MAGTWQMDNCCGCQGSITYTRLIAEGTQYGFSPLPISASVSPGGAGGTRRYTRIDTSCLFTVFKDGTLQNIAITGFMVMDNNNGSISSHGVSDPGGFVAGPAAGTVRGLGQASTITETHAEWTDPTLGVYQSITLSNPIDASNAKILAGALLQSQGDMTGLTAGRAFHIFYPSAGTSFFEGPNSGDWPIASFDAVDQLRAWDAINQSWPQFGDANIGPYVPPAATLVDLGPADQDIRSFSTWPGWADWSAGRLLIRGLPPLSSHCIETKYDAGGHSLGDADNCGDQAVDVNGNLLVMEPSLDFDPTGGNTTALSSGSSYPHLFYHSTAGGNGCPCVADI